MHGTSERRARSCWLSRRRRFLSESRFLQPALMLGSPSSSSSTAGLFSALLFLRHTSPQPESPPSAVAAGFAGRGGGDSSSSSEKSSSIASKKEPYSLGRGEKIGAEGAGKEVRSARSPAAPTTASGIQKLRSSRSNSISTAPFARRSSSVFNTTRMRPWHDRDRSS